MQTSPLLTQLMEALRCLPGVGPKSAQRMAFTLLQRDRSGGMRLAQAARTRGVRKTARFAWWRVLRISTPLSRPGNFPGGSGWRQKKSVS